MHARRKIINAVSNILLGNPQPTPPNPEAHPLPYVGGDVFTNRPTPLWTPELPAVCIYALDDDAENDQEPKYYKRKLKLYIEILVSAEEGSDEICDEIAEEVESLLLYRRFLPDPTYVFQVGEKAFPATQNPANTADNVTLKSTKIVLSGKAVETVVTSCRIEIEVLFNTEPVYPNVPGVFDTADIKTQIEGSTSDTAPTEDLVTHIHQGD